MQIDQSPQLGKRGEDFDPRTRFIRLSRFCSGGFVEVKFDIGDSETSVELIMLTAA